MNEVIEFPPKISDTDASIADLVETVAQMMAVNEAIDQGMKLVLKVLTDQEKRIRALELSIRKLERKNLPVIVNSRGEGVSSNAK